MTPATRPVPVPDERSAPYWEAAAEHVLTVARCSRCADVLHPARHRVPALPQHRPGVRLRAGQRAGVVRSWTVVRQSFLPGFDDDVPFVLVDVELEEQADLRIIGRLLDGPDAALHLGDRVVARPRFERSIAVDGVRRVPAFARHRTDGAIMSGPSRPEPGGDRRVRAQPGAASRAAAARCDRARHRAARDRRRRPRRRRRSTASPPARSSRPRARTRSRTASASSPRTGWPSTSASNPRWAARLPGLRPDPRRGEAGGERGRQRRRRLRAAAPRAAQPAGKYHGNPMREAAGGVQWTAPQGYFGPLAMIALPYNEYLQRYGAAPDAMAAVLVEARKNGARIPWSYWHDEPLTAEEYLAAPMIADPICMYDCDIPVDGVAAFVFTSAERARDLPHRRCTSPATGWARRRAAAPAALAARRHHGRTGARRPAGCGRTPVSGPPTSTCRRCTTGSRRSSTSGSRRSASAGRGRRTRSSRTAASTATRPAALPALSGGGALGNGRMHGVPQMLECYLQLSGRAGDRQRADANVGVACHSSPALRRRGRLQRRPRALTS